MSFSSNVQGTFLGGTWEADGGAFAAAFSGGPTTPSSGDGSRLAHGAAVLETRSPLKPRDLAPALSSIKVEPAAVRKKAKQPQRLPIAPRAPLAFSRVKLDCLPSLLCAPLAFCTLSERR